MQIKKPGKYCQKPGTFRVFLPKLYITCYKVSIMLWLFRSLFVLLSYLGITFYTGLRLFAFIKLFQPTFKAVLFWPLYGLLPYGLIALSFIKLGRLDFLRLIGMYLLPFIIFLFGFVFLFDIAKIILALLNRPLPGIMPAGVGVALAITLLIIVFGSIHARDIKTAHYSLDYGGTEKLRIVLVSDLHIGPTVGEKWVGKIVKRINEADPDVVCMAGDIFDGWGGMAAPESIAAELRRIKAPLGVFACPGNHDTNWQTRSDDEVIHFLTGTGITMLADKAAFLSPADGIPGIAVAGRRDARPIRMESGRLTAQELFSLMETGGGRQGQEKPFTVLLDHQPVELPQEAEAGFDLVLCGHTHKGQFFPGNLFTRSIFKNAGGTHYGHWQKGKTQAVVSSGAGIWGPPIRLATNSEIAVIDIAH